MKFKTTQNTIKIRYNVQIPILILAEQETRMPIMGICRCDIFTSDFERSDVTLRRSLEMAMTDE